MRPSSYGNQHVDLNQINPANVGELKLAFVLRTGDPSVLEWTVIRQYLS